MFHRLSVALAGLLLLVGCASQQLGEPVETTMLPEENLQTIQVTVNHAYEPNHIVAKADVPLRIDFYRNENQTSCAKDVEIPAQAIQLDLPNRQVISVEIPAQAAGEMPFRCTMDMMRGKIVFK